MPEVSELPPLPAQACFMVVVVELLKVVLVVELLVVLSGWIVVVKVVGSVVVDNVVRLVDTVVVELDVVTLVVDPHPHLQFVGPDIQCADEIPIIDRDIAAAIKRTVVVFMIVPFLIYQLAYALF